MGAAPAQQGAPVWRLSAADESWQLSFTSTFLTLSASRYTSRDDFCARLGDAWRLFFDVVGQPATYSSRPAAKLATSAALLLVTAAGTTAGVPFATAAPVVSHPPTGDAKVLADQGQDVTPTVDAELVKWLKGESGLTWDQIARVRRLPACCAPVGERRPGQCRERRGTPGFRGTRPGVCAGLTCRHQKRVAGYRKGRAKPDRSVPSCPAHKVHRDHGDDAERDRSAR